MSAQSSARKKRRESQLFSSQNGRSFLPLPQITSSNLATSTPARGGQGLHRDLPHPLPTPKASSSWLVSTPARAGDDNTTLFGFSPGVEADETQLLALDYRSAPHLTKQKDEQVQDDIFDDTAILEQRAFAHRRTSHEGDQSAGGLGALIFSNLLAGGQAQDALERLELGKRRDSDISRRLERLSPVKRNASFAVSNDGEYLVDYETDVRFGDELEHDVAEDEPLFELSQHFQYPQVNIPAYPSSIIISSPLQHQYDSNDPNVVTESNTTFAHTVGITPAKNATYNSPHPEQEAHHFSPPPQPSTNTMPEPPPEQPLLRESSGNHEDSTMNVAIEQPTEETPLPGPLVHADERSRVSYNPSPSLEERRHARRMRRGLTSSMAIMLSPVAEDKDKERSMSRSRSMLLESLRYPQSDLHEVETRSLPAEDTDFENAHNREAPVVSEGSETQAVAHRLQYSAALPEDRAFKLTSSQPLLVARPDPLEELSADVSLRHARRSPSISLTGSHHTVSVQSGAAENLSCITVQHPCPANGDSISSRPTLVLHNASAVEDPSTSMPPKQIASNEGTKVHSVEVTKVAGPSYMRSTLSRSKQVQEVPVQRQPSGYNRRLVSAQTNTSELRERKKSATTVARTMAPRIKRQRVVSAPVIQQTAKLQVLSRQKSVDDLFERRQRDGSRLQVAEVPGQTRLQPRPASKTTLDAPDRHDRMSHPTTEKLDEGLTVPRSFSFTQSKLSHNRSRQQLSASAQVASTRVRLSRPAAPIRRVHNSENTATRRKASRAPPEAEHFSNGDDPEAGPALALTEAALSVQDKMLDENTARQPLQQDTTTHSEVMQRYLQELAAIDAEVQEADNRETFASTSHTYDEVRADNPWPTSRVSQQEEQQVASPPLKRPRAAPTLRSENAKIRTSQDSRPVARKGLSSQGRAPLAQVHNESTALSKTSKGLSGQQRKSEKPVQQVASSKPADFTFTVAGQQQLSFQERLAAWQAREAEAALAGKPMLQPLALVRKDTAREARKADRPIITAKQPTKAKEFSWHSDRRARERQDWEQRVREKEEILAELAEIRRLEAEAAEAEEIRKMRAAQVPIAHPVPAFIKSRKRTR